MISLAITRLRHAEDVAKAWAEVTAKREISATKALSMLQTGSISREAALASVSSVCAAREQLQAAEKALAQAMEDLLKDRH